MAKNIDDWFIWIEANRDTPTRQWEEEVLPQAKAALLAEMLELVGDYQPTHRLKEYYELEEVPQAQSIRIQNQIKSELRDKLKEYYGDTNG